MAHLKHSTLIVAAALIAALGLLSAFAAKSERTVQRQASGNQAAATVVHSDGQDKPVDSRLTDDPVARP